MLKPRASRGRILKTSSSRRRVLHLSRRNDFSNIIFLRLRHHLGIFLRLTLEHILHLLLLVVRVPLIKLLDDMVRLLLSNRLHGFIPGL